MKKQTVEKMLRMQDTAIKDDCYRSLLAKYRVLDKRFVQLLGELVPEHRNVVMDYLGVVYAIHERMVELALTLDEKS